ncbi:DeoR/GlpR family DNA-binding transcription regulator [Demequina sp.]|uniref:DeoR/GlpR family DNA-binding transcription regulator n=1 Tax=Demequina sp. TaxID=2050685 RepID=UPI003A8418B2
MGREDRLSRLVEYIVDKGNVTIDQIVEDFGTSAPTARRDLDALASQQLVTRTRGGAMANAATGDVPMRYRVTKNARQKHAIALRALDLVEPGTVVAFNGGTTTTAIAYELGILAASDVRFEQSPTTVVTNAINIANDLTVRPQLRIVVLGGVARSRSYELIGPLTNLFLPEITIDTLFLGVNALDPKRGVFTHDEGEAAVNAALVGIAKRTVAVADTSKFSATAFARICAIDAIDAVLTTRDAPADGLRQLEAHGVEVIVADES